MFESADLEIGLHRRDTTAYTVELRYSQPKSEAEVRTGHGQVLLDRDALDKLADRADEYGRLLSAAVFADPSLLAGFREARAVAETQDATLRVNLWIGPSAPELHSLRWETLRDPVTDSPLALGENVLFSRYLASGDWRPVHLRAQGALRALALVANPANLADYRLAPIDVNREIDRARAALGSVPLQALPDTASGQGATLEALFSRLQGEEFDIVYLVAHGTLVQGQPWLWLEDGAGQVQRVSGADLAARFQELQKRPRLVVLFSCESAGASGPGSDVALAAIGPRLAEAGIPAVLAMQGRVTIDTASAFMAEFFRELQRDGRIDRAVSRGRGAVRARPDFWSPALFMRLKSGRIWYRPGFSEGDGHDDDFEKWESLAGFIREKTCTPIIGPGLIDPMLGARREIAIRWAEKNGYPLNPHDRDVLPRVAQYVMTRHSEAYLSVAIREALRDEIICRYEAILPEDLRQRDPWLYPDLSRAMDLVIDNVYPAGRPDPYRRLAEMRLPLYITTGQIGLMSRALKQVGAEPVERLCPWNKWIPKEKSLYEQEPTPEKPLVYHLFGHLNTPNSLVYAEDRYFDYLIGVTQNRDLIPSTVRAALNNTSLLFLGFQMDDWEFRVFFRFLMAQEGRELLRFYTHAAVQVEPDEDRIVDIRRARRYLEDYFQTEKIGTYWGSSEEFLITLSEHVQGTKP